MTNKLAAYSHVVMLIVVIISCQLGVLAGYTKELFHACTTPALSKAEYGALYAFYNGTNGPQWNLNCVEASGGRSMWDFDSGEDPCDNNWIGVYCLYPCSIARNASEVTNSVAELNIQVCGMTGSISSELGLLSNLQILYLDSNSLSGTIPSSLGLLSLSGLSLDSNQLTGESCCLRLPI